MPKAFQDFYPDPLAHCYGCGRLNAQGHQIKTIWDGDETVTRFTPQPYHTAIPGFVYGGLIASLIDCHSTGTAAAAMYRAEGREMDSQPPFRFVTGSLHVDFLKPTPLGVELETDLLAPRCTGRRRGAQGGQQAEQGTHGASVERRPRRNRGVTPPC